MLFPSGWIFRQLAAVALISSLLFTSLSQGQTTSTAGKAYTIDSTILIIAPDKWSSSVATDLLEGYGIPFEVLIVPPKGVDLPKLNNTDGSGNYGGIVVLSLVSFWYEDVGMWKSALSNAQWTLMYDYQKQYGVRMVHQNAYPGAAFGSEALGGCCDVGVEQTVTLDEKVAASEFPSAGLKSPTVNLTGLWHYPAKVTDTKTTTCFLTLGTTPDYTSPSCGGVINKIDGREQMVFFSSFGSWSAVSMYMGHMWIHWVTRGIFAGYRRILFSTQIDDLLLPSAIYPDNHIFRLRTTDVSAHLTWQSDLNERLKKEGNTGSNYTMEFGFNGNGAFIATQELGIPVKTCPLPITYTDDQPIVPLEYMKPIGTGKDLWPEKANFSWNAACAKKDPLTNMFVTNLKDKFAMVSHTFTHEGENPITYADAKREIGYNQQFATMMGIDKWKLWSPKGLIPPAITGLHNGDALRAWMELGLTNCVGDNTRPPLMNKDSSYWPLYTNVQDNGYAGFQIVPRFSTRIYYNADSMDSTTQEWVETSGGKGDYLALLALERASTGRNLLGLHQDPYMFHQANMRVTDQPKIKLNGIEAQLSIVQSWTEAVLAEVVQYVNWPIVTKKHDDIAAAFAARFNRDKCDYGLSYVMGAAGNTITGVTVTGNKNCKERIPVTLPTSGVKDLFGNTKEVIGKDPWTIWTDISKGPVTFTLKTAVKVNAAGPPKAVSSNTSTGKATGTAKASSSAAGGTVVPKDASSGSSSAANVLIPTAAPADDRPDDDSKGGSADTNTAPADNDAKAKIVAAEQGNSPAKVKRREHKHKRHGHGH